VHDPEVLETVVSGAGRRVRDIVERRSGAGADDDKTQDDETLVDVVLVDTLDEEEGHGALEQEKVDHQFVDGHAQDDEAQDALDQASLVDNRTLGVRSWAK
jgi:hypothetical protein